MILLSREMVAELFRFTPSHFFMSDFKFPCPHCSQNLKCEEQHSGRQIQCPKCNHLIVIPPVPGRTADFKPDSGMTWNTHIPRGDKK
jgi:DNA-directed RNA polymerase subunit RPC12/RpoP